MTVVRLSRFHGYTVADAGEKPGGYSGDALRDARAINKPVETERALFFSSRHDSPLRKSFCRSPFLSTIFFTPAVRFRCYGVFSRSRKLFLSSGWIERRIAAPGCEFVAHVIQRNTEHQLCSRQILSVNSVLATFSLQRNIPNWRLTL